jgi:methionyl-tRNA synthetase
MYLWPIIPRFSEACARVLNVQIDKMNSRELFALRNHSMGPMERLFDRLERKNLDAMIEAAKEQIPPTNHIDYDQFSKIELRAGTIVEAEAVPKSKKLLRLLVDVGEATPRQIISGLALNYEPASLVGTQVVVVVNLKPARLMGYESQGMVLAAGEGDKLALLRLDQAMSPGTVVK